jgi:hypothetical protein
MRPLQLDLGEGKIYSTEMADAMGRLRNTKHERFAREVAALVPLAVAYREAGFGGDPRWHPFNASKLANKPKVKQRIDELRLQFEQLSAIHVDYVRHQLLHTVDADPRELYERDPDDPTGKRHRLRRISELPRHLATAISRVKIDPENGQPVEVILGNKNEAAATLLRSLPGGSDEQSAPVGLQQFNFSWGAAGDISHDIPLQLAQKTGNAQADSAMMAKLAALKDSLKNG